MDDRLLIKEAYYGDINEVRRLLESGANPNIKDPSYDEDAWTPLLYASSYGFYEIANLLLDYEADPNIPDDWGQTPLMWASYKGHEEIVRLLLESGADPNVIDHYGRTSLMVAEEMGYDNVVRLIQYHIDQDEQSDIDEPSDPDIDLLRDEAARYIQTIMRARIETDKKRKLTKRRYGKWASPKTKREKDRRYMDLIRQIDYDDPMKGYERYAIYPERLLPHKKGGKRSKGKHGKKRSKRRYARNRY